MNAEIFLDTNILVYGVAQRDTRTPKAEMLLRRGGTISVQVLNEFTNVAHRKLNRTWPEIQAAIRSLRILFPAPKPLTAATHAAALTIAEQSSFAFYDALIIASAMEAGCSTLLSEDMQHGQVINGRLTIRNPFL